MTATDDKKLETFYNDVVCLMVEHRTRFLHIHYPDTDCFRGKCTFKRTTCNWKPLLHLVAWFFKYGTNITEAWKRDAQLHDFNTDHLHELLLGVFVGGDRGTTDWVQRFNRGFSPDSIWATAHEAIPAP